MMKTRSCWYNVKLIDHTTSSLVTQQLQSKIKCFKYASPVSHTIILYPISFKNALKVVFSNSPFVLFLSFSPEDIITSVFMVTCSVTCHFACNPTLTFRVTSETVELEHACTLWLQLKCQPGENVLIASDLDNSEAILKDFFFSICCKNLARREETYFVNSTLPFSAVKKSF